ncbi:MAG: cobalamin [Acidobacteria bacterium]|jgi:cobalt/nickel transport system permease protein|nr:cobalamin [Acidobacteriota bacterium]
MHIPDGFLSTRIAVSLDAISGATILYASRRVRFATSDRLIPVMGVLAAFVFASQMLNFPIIGGTSGHLVGGALLGILLGPMAGFLTMATVLIAQALFLQDGGLLALGANIFNIGAVTAFVGHGTYSLLGGGKGNPKRVTFAGFVAAFLSLIASAACCALQLALSGTIPLQIGLPAMVGYHAVIGMIEGGLTAGILSFLLHVRPDLLNSDIKPKLNILDWAGALILVAIPAAILATAGSSGLPDPLQGLLISNAPPPPSAADAQQLLSSGRFTDYAFRLGIFFLFVCIVYIAARLAPGRRHSP